MSKYSVDLATLISALWDNIKEFIPEKKKEDVAAGIIESLIKSDLVDEIKMLEEAYGVDPALDEAIAQALEEHAEAEQNDEESDVDEF